MSSRGTKVPNYVDDVQDFEQFDDDEVIPGAYVDPNAPQKEEDEIEMVLGHSRDDDHKEDPEDNWYTNIVRRLFLLTAVESRVAHIPAHSGSTSNGRRFRTCTTPTKCTSSSSGSKVSSA